MGQSPAVCRLVGWVYGAPEGLPELPSVERLSPSTIRVLGQNPGPATLQGTNTYLLGTGSERILVDTSDGNGRWWPLLHSLLADEGAVVKEVVLTHRHYDHVGGVACVRTAFPGARLWKGPDSFLDGVPPPPAAPEAPRRRSRPRRMGQCACGGALPEDCAALSEGQCLEVQGAKLETMHTPGHSSDSCCFLLQGEAVLTGDTVLGGVAGVFEDIAAYRSSLRQLQEELREAPMALYPGHGAVVATETAVSYVESLLDAMQRRERAVREALRNAGSATADEVCSALYGDGAASAVAGTMVEQHLKDLVAKSLARESPGWISTSYESLDPRPAEAQGGWFA